MTIVVSILATAGYQVIQAYDGRDARAPPHDLVVTDLAMPEMSGVEVIPPIKRDMRWAQIRVVAVTGFAWMPPVASLGFSLVRVFPS